MQATRLDCHYALPQGFEPRFSAPEADVTAVAPRENDLASPRGESNSHCRDSEPRASASWTTRGCPRGGIRTLTVMDLIHAPLASWATRGYGVVPSEGFEPTLSGVWNRCLWPLGYEGLSRTQESNLTCRKTRGLQPLWSPARAYGLIRAFRLEQSPGQLLRGR